MSYRKKGKSKSAGARPAANSEHTKSTSEALIDNRPASPIQKAANNTGLPDNLKTGMENLSGHNLNHVKVNYNSPKPAAVQAHAYAQGNQIHVASGQEKYLPHELGHVVQQMEGRVKPTTNVNGLAVNDNAGLEREADMMGAQALQAKFQNLDRLETRQLKAKSVQYEVNYASALPENIGLKGTQQMVSPPIQLPGFEASSYITQMKSSVASPVIQMVRTPEGSQVRLLTGNTAIVAQLGIIDGALSLVSNYGPAALVAAEGVLSISAGMLGFMVNTPAAMTAIVVGLGKLVRSILMFCEAKYGQSPERRKWIDSIRTTEAWIAAIWLNMGVAFSDPSATTKVVVKVFTISKAIRSIMLGMEMDKSKTGAYIIQGLQLLEGLSLLVGGAVGSAAASGEHEETVKTVGGLGAGIGASKMLRGGIDGTKAYNKFNP